MTIDTYPLTPMTWREWLLADTMARATVAAALDTKSVAEYRNMLESLRGRGDILRGARE